jgi:hypothetical protein
MPKTNLSETGVLNFRSVLGGMTLLLVGSLSTVVAANPAQAAFSFVQENYQVPSFSSPGTSSQILFSPSVGRVNGNFEGSDLNGDGSITCLRGGSCEITSFRASFGFTAQGVLIRQNNQGLEDRSPITVPTGVGFSGYLESFNLSYALGDPLSLRINYDPVSNLQALSIDNGSGSVSGYLFGLNGRITATTNSPAIVSGDSTAAPEPATMAGLLLAGGVGVWLKRRS